MKIYNPSNSRTVMCTFAEIMEFVIYIKNRIVGKFDPRLTDGSLPTPAIKEEISKSESHIKELMKKIDKNGYNPRAGKLTVFELDGKMYLGDGQHRREAIRRLNKLSMDEYGYPKYNEIPVEIVTVDSFEEIEKEIVALNDGNYSWTQTSRERLDDDLEAILFSTQTDLDISRSSARSIVLKLRGGKGYDGVTYNDVAAYVPDMLQRIKEGRELLLSSPIGESVWGLIVKKTSASIESFACLLHNIYQSFKSADQKYADDEVKLLFKLLNNASSTMLTKEVGRDTYKDTIGSRTGSKKLFKKIIKGSTAILTEDEKRLLSDLNVKLDSWSKESTTKKK